MPTGVGKRGPSMAPHGVMGIAVQTQPFARPFEQMSREAAVHGWEPESVPTRVSRLLSTEPLVDTRIRP